MKLFDLTRLFGLGGDGETSPSATHRPDGGAGPTHTRHAQAARSREDALRDPDAAYGYGVADGRREVAGEHFRRYLEHSTEAEELDARIAALDESERTLEARLATVREERAESAARTVKADHLRERVATATERLDAIGDELGTAGEAQEQIRKRGLLGYTFMFGLAAIAFILADVVITRTIVADALGLTGRTFLRIDEAWYFAAGLALLAVLLKPAYDRLVEERYWEGDRRWFTGAILGASLLALATLAVLGIFRAVGFEAQTLARLALEAPGADAAEQWARLRDLQETVVTSAWGKAAFTMSGVLFAIAGAICLGIGLRHFHDFRHVRRPLRHRQRALKKERDRLADRYAKDAMALNGLEAELRRAEVRLGDLPSPDRLAEDLHAVREGRQALLERRTNVRRGRLESAYADGYDLGRRLGEPGPPDEAPRPHGGRPRPYVALRRSIRAQHDAGDGTADAAPDARDPDT